MISRCPARWMALLIVAFGLALVPATSSASSTATVEVYNGGVWLNVHEEWNETQDDDLTVSFTAGGYVVTDTAGISPGERCTKIKSTSVRCAQGSGADEVRNLSVGSFAGDDTIKIASSVSGMSQVWLDGGSGNDTITGGPTDDHISGWFGEDHIDGGGGDDLISTHPLSVETNIEPDETDDGDDSVDGGAGEDTISYGEIVSPSDPDTLFARVYPVTVVLRGATPTTGNGQFSENDTLVNIENVQGAYRNDTIDGGDADNQLSGGYGNDTLIGGDGNDDLDGNQQADTLDGGGGNDLLNLRESPSGQYGTADLGADCGSGSDHIATDPVDPSAQIVNCEHVAPLVVAYPQISQPNTIFPETILTLTSLQVTGSPQPTTIITWQSCGGAPYTCENRATGTTYTVVDADIGRSIRASVTATSAFPTLPALYNQSTSISGIVGSVLPRTPPPPATVSRAPTGPPTITRTPLAPPLITGPTEAARLLGAPARQLADMRPLVTYVRAGKASTVRVRRGRRVDLVAMVCLGASCNVTITRTLTLHTRSHGRDRTRQIKLPTSHRALQRAQSAVASVSLSTAQRAAVRRARSTTLKIAIAVRNGTPAARASATFKIGLR